MTGETHLMAGVLVALAMPDPISGAGALCLLGSIAPDLDAGPKRITLNPARLPFRVARWFTKHRGLLHGEIPLIMVWGAAWLVGGPWYGLALGWTSHILLDAFTKHGVKLLGVRLRLLPKPLQFTTGGKAELYLLRGLMVAGVLYLTGAVPAILTWLGL